MYSMHLFALGELQDSIKLFSWVAGEVVEVKQKLQNEIIMRKAAQPEVNNLKNQLIQLKNTEVFLTI